jgi:hypothetical protein
MFRFRSLAAALVTIACVGALVEAGLWMASTEPSATGPHVQLVTDHQDLGRIAAGEWVEARFVIANTGREPLVFRRARSGFWPDEPTPPLTTVAPGRTSQIVLSVDPADLASRGGRQHFNFLTNDPQRPEFWLTVAGTVGPPPLADRSAAWVHRP